MLILRYLAKLLKALASEASPKQLAGGAVLGMVIGLTPLFSLHNAVIVLLILILRVNIGISILAFLIFSGVAWLADPLFHDIGFWLLNLESLEGFWTMLYNVPAVALTRFYNTIVLGSLVSALLLTLPAYPLFIRLVGSYRAHIHARIQHWKLVKAVKGSRFYDIYQRVNAIRR